MCLTDPFTQFYPTGFAQWVKHFHRLKFVVLLNYIRGWPVVWKAWKCNRI